MNGYTDPAHWFVNDGLPEINGKQVFCRDCITKPLEVIEVWMCTRCMKCEWIKDIMNPHIRVKAWIFFNNLYEGNILVNEWIYNKRLHEQIISVEKVNVRDIKCWCTWCMLKHDFFMYYIYTILLISVQLLPANVFPLCSVIIYCLFFFFFLKELFWNFQTFKATGKMCAEK